MSTRKFNPSVIVTNKAASRLPGGSKNFGKDPALDPVSAKPRQRPGEVVRNSEHVRVTSRTLKTQRPKQGNY
jgi:hypothetical protein